MVYGTYNILIIIVTGANLNPTYNWGASHCNNWPDLQKQVSTYSYEKPVV